MPGKHCRHEPLIHPVTIPRCVGNKPRSAGRQPISKAGGEVRRVYLAVGRSETTDIIHPLQRDALQPVGDDVHVVITLHGEVIAMLTRPHTDGLNLERNPTIGIVNIEPDFISWRYSCAPRFRSDATEKELHVGVTTPYDILYPRGALSISPSTLLVTRHYGD